MEIFDYSRTAFPKLVQQRLEELRKSDTTATYEQALKLASKENASLYETYCHAVGSDN